MKTKKHAVYYPIRLDSSQCLVCSEESCSLTTWRVALKGWTRREEMSKQQSSPSESISNANQSKLISDFLNQGIDIERRWLGKVVL